ncbi:accumulation of dyads protein 2 [[Candida] anglica]|uniref:Accumulation of dyads protein 2 n=1 Tax=[Candida] anglica TaxID=148631 RepID=A0ABP0EB56_9ASCO
MSESHSSAGSKERHSDELPPPSNIQHAGEGNEFVVIGNQKFYRHELMQAFGGTLNPGLAPPPVHQFANPSPLGLSAFALTTFVLSMYNAQAMGIETPNMVVGLAAFYGGAVQFLAGVWEMVVGNTFAATALSSYGAFWLSYAAINVKAFGIAAAYGADKAQMKQAVAFFLLAWALFTFMLFLCTMKSTVAFAALFGCLTLTFILLAAGDFSGEIKVTRAGGVVGVITAFLGFYNAFAGTANSTNSYFTAYPIQLTKS